MALRFGDGLGLDVRRFRALASKQASAESWQRRSRLLRTVVELPGWSDSATAQQLADASLLVPELAGPSSGPTAPLALEGPGARAPARTPWPLVLVLTWRSEGGVPPGHRLRSLTVNLAREGTATIVRLARLGEDEVVATWRARACRRSGSW